jgi:membrane dipeptidase
MYYISGNRNDFNLKLQIMESTAGVIGMVSTNLIKVILPLLAIFLLAGCQSGDTKNSAKPLTDEEIHQKAQELAQKFIITDGHIDVPYRLQEYMEDISQQTIGDFDYPKAKTGGLNAPFMSIYVPARLQKEGGAKEFADNLIDMVETFAAGHPDKFAVARSVADVRQQFQEGKVSLAMGMENGAPVEGNPENLQHFYRRGIRYITLTHSEDNEICDSSYDSTRTWNGLSPFGENVVAEMNRLGIMVDISHVSDSAFYDVMRITSAPVIASHSSCRFFTPDWERNMNDEIIKKLAESGGVICINFGSSFLKSEFQGTWSKAQKEIKDHLAEHKIEEGSKEAAEYYQQYRHERPKGTVADVADHIDHAVKLAGVDYVGFGSDFDGVLSLPAGLQDVSGYPNLIEELLKRGYSEEDIENICGGNMLRVWSEVERIAQQNQLSAK